MKRTVNREIKNKTAYYVARENGKVLARRKVAGSGMNLESARDVFLRNGTFDPEKKHQRASYRYTVEHVITRIRPGTMSKPKTPKGIGIQYTVKAQIGHETIAARSKKGFARTQAEIDLMRLDAMDNFYRRLHQFFSPGGYDEDEGMQIAQQNNIVPIEGWVYYTPRKVRV